MRQEISAQRLLLQLTAYFLLLFGSVLWVGMTKPDLLSVMPLGGTNALQVAGIEVGEPTGEGKSLLQSKPTVEKQPTVRQLGLIVVFLAFSLGGTLLVMLPITWTYAATRRDIGFRKNFVRALMVLPICATTIVMLIQNNLALAFGMALFFCFTNVLLWHFDYGQNPIDNRRIAKKHAEFDAPTRDSSQQLP